MSIPTVTSSDLETFLGMGDGTIDPNRATLILQMAQNLCESIAYPLPATASVVVLSVAARGFSNPQGIAHETVGPYQVQFAPLSAGMYLSRGDKATIRRLAGGSGAFSIETLPPGVNAVQTVTVTATGGAFLLSLTGASTIPLAYNALSGAVQTALQALTIIGPGNVAVTGNGPYIVTFVNHLGTTPVPTMGFDSSLLTGPAPLVTVVTTTTGIYKPGQGLAPWDRDYLQGNQLGAGGQNELGGGGTYY